MTDLLISILPTLLYWGFILCCLLIALLILFLVQEQRQPIRHRVRRKSQPRQQRHPELQPIASVPRELQERLMAMVGGHRPTAHRLLSLERKTNPGRSEEWYFSKVIEDLVRDRR